MTIVTEKYKRNTRKAYKIIRRLRISGKSGGVLFSIKIFQFLKAIFLLQVSLIFLFQF